MCQIKGEFVIMQRNSLHLFKLFGIPIRMHTSWLSSLS